MSISHHDVMLNDLSPAPPDRKVQTPLDLAQMSSGIETIIGDGIRHSMSLAGLAGQLEIFLDAIEIHKSADGLETFGYNDRLLSSQWKVRIEMCANDTCDAEPHCHVTHNNECASYDLKDYNWLGGAVVDPNTAEMVRTFFAQYGAGERMASILRSDVNKTSNAERDTNLLSSVFAQQAAGLI